MVGSGLKQEGLLQTVQQMQAIGKMVEFGLKEVNRLQAVQQMEAKLICPTM